jgi:hypothetical protein
MVPQGPTTDLLKLRAAWSRWTALVAMFVRRARARLQVDAQAYHALHHQLLADCRTQAENAGEGKRAFYEGLETLAAPWLTLQCLARADGEILGDLLARCRLAEEQLGGQPCRPTAGRWVTTAVTVLAAGALSLLALWLTLWVVQGKGNSAVEYLQDGWHTVWLAIKSTTFPQRLLVGAVIAVVGGILVVSRTMRT